jgi:hypothetical protein
MPTTRIGARQDYKRPPTDTPMTLRTEKIKYREKRSATPTTLPYEKPEYKEKGSATPTIMNTRPVKSSEPPREQKSATPTTLNTGRGSSNETRRDICGISPSLASIVISWTLRMCQLLKTGRMDRHYKPECDTLSDCAVAVVRCLQLLMARNIVHSTVAHKQLCINPTAAKASLFG